MKLLVLCFFVSFFVSCSSKHEVDKEYKNFSSPQAYEIAKLEHTILSLSSSINKKEAQNLSKILILHSLELANSYGITGTAWMHNSLINLGLKERGFCYHYTQDLIEKINEYDFKTLKFYWAVHKKGEYFEHNALVVSSKYQNFLGGLILDAWRNSGELFYLKVLKDEAYSWSENKAKTSFYFKEKEE